MVPISKAYGAFKLSLRHEAPGTNFPIEEPEKNKTYTELASHLSKLYFFLRLLHEAF